MDLLDLILIWYLIKNPAEVNALDVFNSESLHVSLFSTACNKPERQNTGWKNSMCFSRSFTFIALLPLLVMVDSGEIDRQDRRQVLHATIGPLLEWHRGHCSYVIFTWTTMLGAKNGNDWRQPRTEHQFIWILQ